MYNTRNLKNTSYKNVLKLVLMLLMYFFKKNYSQFNRNASAIIVTYTGSCFTLGTMILVISYIAQCIIQWGISIYTGLNTNFNFSFFLLPLWLSVFILLPKKSLVFYECKYSQRVNHSLSQR